MTASTFRRPGIAVIVPSIAAMCMLAPVYSISAQNMPTLPPPAEAEAALRAKPELVTQVQQRLRASGLSQSQVRSRLRAASLPADSTQGFAPPE